MILTDLAEKWRAKAGELLGYGASEAVATLKTCAAELDDCINQWETEPLTLQEAAEESRYTYSSLQQMVAGERLRNVGTKNAPRILRGDLPRKPRPPDPKRVEGGPDIAQEILARRAAS